MRYTNIALFIEKQIRTGALKTGDRLPSVRKLSVEKNVSQGTVVKAYFELERRQLIASRPQSGFYVSFAGRQNSQYAPGLTAPASAEGSVADIFYTVFNNRAKEINLSSSQIAADLLPISKLNKELMIAIKNLQHGGVAYSSSGNPKLKKQVARRSLSWGGNLKPEDIIPTSGSMDALALCLSALLKPGDTIAVESPVNFGIINLAQMLGFRLLELPTNPATGIDIDAVRGAIKKESINLCLIMGNYSNPFGSGAPPEYQKELVGLLEQNGIPLIEDDVFGELYFERQVPTCCKTFDQSGNVLFCSSVSKILAGGYRVGWLAPGKYKDRIERARPYHAQTCNTITHEAVAGFMENNGYENYLKSIRQKLHIHSLQFQSAVRQYFPESIKVTQPDGGIHLWLELEQSKETIKLYNKAMVHRIGITPGRMYTMQNQFNNCFTLNFSLELNAKVEKALALLGKCSMQL